MSIVFENLTTQAVGIDPKDIPYPEVLRLEKPPYKPEVRRIAVDRFISREYHELEMERIWKKSWQWACREEDIPAVGDHVVYEVAHLSFIVMRVAEREFKAYWNACLHRGRKLFECSGSRADEIRCMYHGWAWNIDGSMKHMTCGYDFPGTKDEVSQLPEARVDSWGGFVFINPDTDCEPLADFLGELPQHFEGQGHDLAGKWKQVHVVADLPANWKIVQEAFIEQWHSSFTHPQFVRSPNSSHVGGIRWDDFGNWMRSAPALPTDKHKTAPGWATMAENDRQVIAQHWDYSLNEDLPFEPEEGVPVMSQIFARVRAEFRKIIGEEIDKYNDIDLVGSYAVHLWPNFHPWGGFSRLVYRFRPHPSGSPDRALMDVLLMAPWPKDKPRPPASPIRYIGADQSITEAPELGMLARVFLQDITNMDAVQKGLKTSRTGYVICGKLQDAPVRHFHDLYDKWMGFEEGDYLARWQPGPAQRSRGQDTEHQVAE